MKSLGDYVGCREYEKVVSKAVAEEGGLRFELINDSRVEIAKWRIDDCVIGAEDGRKCDFLMVVKERSTCYWIELKDQDMEEACLQIYSSINRIKEAKDYKTHYARIILGRFIEERNRITSLRYTNLRKLINVIGGIENLQYKTKILIEKI